MLIAAMMFANLSLNAKPMKARTIQPLYAKDAVGLESSFQWTLDALRDCDPSLDIIVLPEFSEVPGSTANKEFLEVVRRNGPALLQLCSETAKRCNALVFCGAIDITPEGARNTIVVYDRKGKRIGGYLKEHLTRGEWEKLGLDKSYTQVWNAPYTLEIEGLRYAFLTCYDFYFYENFSNIARTNPDIIIGSSHQRSDTHRALDIIDAFCAYNTGAYLVRASVSMGEDSPLGGCSCVVAPTGEILSDMYSIVGVMDTEFDPEQKYLKPAGYGNPPAKHSQYIEIGRRPWKYRPGGSAIVLPLDENNKTRLCASKGYSSISDNRLAAYGAAVAVGASEIGIQVGNEEELKVFEKVLHQLSCHTIMNVRVENGNKAFLKNLCKTVHDYDADCHVYFSSSNAKILKQLEILLPETDRCLVLPGKNVKIAADYGCAMLQFDYSSFNSELARQAHEAGFRCVVSCPDNVATAKQLIDDGADTLIVGDYVLISNGTGIN